VIINGTYKGQDYRLDDRKYTVGPTPNEDIVVQDDYLSSPHCAIRYENGTFIINDLGSKNKTFVNGEPQTEWELIDNDHIKIGQTEMIFKCL
jgi:pSer/pThr/pTyr-binding forkhead associated (FHA) protein